MYNTLTLEIMNKDIVFLIVRLMMGVIAQRYDESYISLEVCQDMLLLCHVVLIAG